MKIWRSRRDDPSSLDRLAQVALGTPTPSSVGGGASACHNAPGMDPGLARPPNDRDAGHGGGANAWMWQSGSFGANHLPLDRLSISHNPNDSKSSLWSSADSDTPGAVCETCTQPVPSGMPVCQTCWFAKWDATAKLGHLMRKGGGSASAPDAVKPEPVLVTPPTIASSSSFPPPFPPPIHAQPTGVVHTTCYDSTFSAPHVATSIAGAHLPLPSPLVAPSYVPQRAFEQERTVKHEPMDL